MSEQKTLADALTNEQNRVRELLPQYDAIPTGFIAAAMMRESLTKAEKAAASGDVIAIMLAYKELKSYE